MENYNRKIFRDLCFFDKIKNAGYRTGNFLRNKKRYLILLMFFYYMVKLSVFLKKEC